MPRYGDTTLAAILVQKVKLEVVAGFCSFLGVRNFYRSVILASVGMTENRGASVGVTKIWDVRRGD
jgi:hypothetical protein